MGTDLNAQFNHYGHYVNLPGGLINLKLIKDIMNNKELISQFNFSLRDIHLVYLEKLEKLSIWRKRVKYVSTKNLIGDEILDEAIKEYKIFQKRPLQYNHIFLDEDILVKADNQVSYFSTYVLISSTLELLTNQSITEWHQVKCTFFRNY